MYVCIVIQAIRAHAFVANAAEFHEQTRGSDVVVFFYLEAYSPLLLIYVLSRLIRKKKLDYRLLIINSIVIAAFFFIRQKFYDQEWSFFGEYLDASEDWGPGMSNFWVTIFNLGIVFIIFWISQVIFWIKFKKAIEVENKIDTVEVNL